VKKIVVIGTGRMGGAFATAFAKRTSYAVSIRGSHAGSSSASALSRQLGVRVADDKEILAADVVFVATPPAALDDVAAALKGYAGIIVSAMVPGAGGYELKLDDGTSAAEQLARLVPTGRARHCVYVHFLGVDPRSREWRNAYCVYLRGR
jgi:predicted dinucleotide-binding enzyme